MTLETVAGMKFGSGSSMKVSASSFSSRSARSSSAKDIFLRINYLFIAGFIVIFAISEKYHNAAYVQINVLYIFLHCRQYSFLFNRVSVRVSAKSVLHYPR